VSALALHPFVVSTLAWEPRPGSWSLTVCLKSTFALAHGQEAPLAPQQDGIHEDVYFEQAPHASLYSPSDFAPFKPRADVLLVGHAYAPGGAPVDRVPVRLLVGELAKALWVVGDRAWVQTAEGLRPSAPRPFAQMPVRYERGALRGDNLVGLGVEPGRPLPNVDVADPSGAAQTPGFGPIAPAWRARRLQLSPEAAAWVQRLRAPAAQGPAPGGLDPGFFNAAPRDQQVAAIAPGAPLMLENLSPRAPRLVTRLPAFVPRVYYVEPGSGRHAEIAVRCDTLWIDTDREAMVLSWRGATPIAAPAEKGPGRILVAVHPPGAAVTYEEVERLVLGYDPTDAPTPLMAESPLRGVPPGEGLGSTVHGGPSPLRDALPFQPGSGAPVLPATPKRRLATGTVAFAAIPASMGDLPGAPWAALPATPPPRPDEQGMETVITASPLAGLAPPPPVHEEPPAAAPSPPPPPPQKAEPPAGSPWRSDPPPAPAAPPPRAPPTAPPPPAVKSSLYEEFGGKRRG
jgi:hypothetical protein